MRGSLFSAPRPSATFRTNASMSANGREAGLTAKSNRETVLQQNRQRSSVSAGDDHEPSPVTVPHPRPQLCLALLKMVCLQSGSRHSGLVHNHPSGDPTPSQADIQMTKAIIDIAAPLGISVHDHVIVGRNGHASLKGMRLI